MNDMENENLIDMEEEEIEEEEILVDLSAWELVKYLFSEPSKTMSCIAKKPKTLFPFLAILLGFTLMIFPRMGLLEEFLHTQLEENLAMQGMDISQMPPQIMKWTFISTIAAAVIGPVFIWFFKGLVVHILASITGSKGKLKAALSVIGYAYLIQLLGGGIQTIISIFTQNFLVHTSPAMFLSASQLATPLGTFLQALDVFAIWYLAVATIGIAYAYAMSQKKAALIVFGSWAAMVLFSVGSAMLKMK